MKLFAALAVVLLGTVVAAQAETFSVGEFEFTTPEGWKAVQPSSPMRKAQLSVPGEPEPAEVTFFHFGPGQGGGPQANIDRWVGQIDGGIENAMQKTEQFGATKVWFVTATGTFQSGMPGGPITPKEGYGLRGAILESKDGDVFVKMTGPEAVVSGAAGAFDAMIEAAAKK